MKSLNAFGIAALVAASTATAAFAGIDDDAAAQTPFIRAEAQNAVTRNAADFNLGNATVNRWTLDQDDAAVQTPFVYEDASNADVVTRNDVSYDLGATRVSSWALDQDDAAVQTPYIYNEAQ